MIWQDKGFLLHHSALGERHFIASFLTEKHGRSRGWVRNNKPQLIPGNAYHVMWKSRLEDHLGHFSLDEDCGFFWSLSRHQGALRALHLMCAICHQLLPERVAMPRLFFAFQSTLEQLNTSHGLRTYNHFEQVLFQELGYEADPVFQYASDRNSRGKDAYSGIDTLRELQRRHQDYLRHWPQLHPLHRIRHAFIQEVEQVFLKTR